MGKKIFIVSLVLLLIISMVIVPIKLESSERDKGSEEIVKKSSISTGTYDDYEEISPFEIHNNSQFHEKAFQENWVGSGTKNDPYIIEGYEVGGYSSFAGIFIENTTVYFEIRECDFRSVNPNPFPGNTGLALDDVKNAFIHNNIFKNNPIGISLFGDNEITIKNNKFSSYDHDVRFYQATNVTLINNSMDKGLEFFGSKKKYWNTHEIDTSNRIGDDPIIYWKDRKGEVVPEEAGQVILANTTGVTVEDLNISEVTDGILVGFSENCVFRNNTVSPGDTGLVLLNSSSNLVTKNSFLDGHSTGISMFGSDDNEIIENDILRIVNRGLILYSCDGNRFEDNRLTSDYCDFVMEGSEENVFFNNSFGREKPPYYINQFKIRKGSVNNLFYNNKFLAREEYGANVEGENEWDAGDPAEGGEGGNYWSGYEGEDRGDGVSDEPFVMNSDNQDNYPWMRKEMKLLYNLTVNTEGKGYVDKEPEGERYFEGTEVVLKAVADKDWHFVNWTGDVDDLEEEETTIILDENKEITAHFEEGPENHSLTVNTEGEGSVDIEPDKTEYVNGSTVNLTAVAEEGWHFVGWSGDVVGEEKKIMLTMDDDKNITARFEKVPASVFRVDDFNIFVDGMEITVTIDLKNIGDAEGTIDLMISGEVVKSVTLESGEERAINYNHGFDEEGEYTVEVGDETKTVKVDDGKGSSRFTSILLLSLVLIIVLAGMVYYWVRVSE
ncbi:MAG: InlB B-repeat-containing protein [Thermoplasmatota archaeon]